MTRQYQIPGDVYVSETGSGQYQIPGGAFLNDASGTSPDATAPGAALTSTSTLSAGAASGVSPGLAPGAALTGTSSLVGGVATATNYGTLTTKPLKNNTGTVLASETGIVMNIYHPTTGVLIVQKTGVTTDAGGIAVVTDPLIAASTTYAYEPVLTGGRRRLPTKAAT